MSRLMRVFTIVTAVLMAVAAPASAATPEQIDAALAKAKAWLYKAQKPDGTWEQSDAPQANQVANSQTGGQWGGRTAIATYALLAAGESPQDPRLAKAIEFLKKADIRGTYALALRAQVWYFLPHTTEVKQLMARDANLLMRMMLTQGNALGHYPYLPGATDYSHSRSQYGVLGVWAAAQMNAEIPQRYWQAVEAGWLQNIHPSGGWTYKHPKDTTYPVTPGMTAAGVASLYIMQDYLYATRGLDCKTYRPAPSDRAIEAGMAWLIKNFDKVATSQKYDRDFPFATLYAIERVGVASGQKYFGTIDWFDKGANWLLKVQEPSGSFRKGTHQAIGELPATCFGILFLARGRAPIMMNKLQYDGSWNNRPRDAANVARWAGRSFERELNWQIVNLKGAAAADLHDAPILYIAGNEALKFSDEDKKTLRAYIDQGGIILGHADCNAAAFTRSFQQLGKELFPSYEFRVLPDDHPIYTINFQRSHWRNPPQVHGLSNGVRELMLLIPNGDPARSWQMQAVGGNEAAWQLGVNLYLYATDRDVSRVRGQTHYVAADDKIKPASTIQVARLQYDGNWDPEPGGWQRLASVMHNQQRVTLKTTTVKLGQPIEGKIAHLTGTAPFQIDDAGKDALRNFIQNGGTLVIDAAGGSSEFASSAEALISELLPDAKLETLPANHPLFSATGKAIEKFEYRAAARRMLGSLDGPRLKAIRQGDRLAVIYSREDLSAGLVGQSIEGVVGYTPQTATELMARILTHASK